MTNARLSKIVPYAVAGAAAGYLYYVAANIDYHARAGVLGPDFWPKLILALTIAACAYEIVRLLFFAGRDGEVGGVLEEVVEDSAGKHGEIEARPAAVSHPLLLALGMAATLVYVAAVQKLGFFLATALYFALFMVIGRYRRWGVIAAVSLLGTLLLMFIFMKLVYVSLPIGVEPFSRVTFLLMQLMGIR
ncbi:MAG: tripartite tricarboxylate transporter TctB family protein [Betaproteobacteria bacterium]|nr:tripartite tricarboxylate transporter TctB family protein [Betaproteobacteria bacterium]